MKPRLGTRSSTLPVIGRSFQALLPMPSTMRRASVSMNSWKPRRTGCAIFYTTSSFISTMRGRSGLFSIACRSSSAFCHNFFLLLVIQKYTLWSMKLRYAPWIWSLLYILYRRKQDILSSGSPSTLSAPPDIWISQVRKTWKNENLEKCAPHTCMIAKKWR